MSSCPNNQHSPDKQSPVPKTGVLCLTQACEAVPHFAA